jgi:hypothetical protein
VRDGGVVAHEKLMRCMQQFSGRRIGTDRKSVASVWRTCQGEWREVREEKRIEEANQGKRLTRTMMARLTRAGLR